MTRGDKSLITYPNASFCFYFPTIPIREGVKKNNRFFHPSLPIGRKPVRHLPTLSVCLPIGQSLSSGKKLVILGRNLHGKPLKTSFFSIRLLWLIRCTVNVVNQIDGPP